jgi:hypothetical protein
MALHGVATVEASAAPRVLGRALAGITRKSDSAGRYALTWPKVCWRILAGDNSGALDALPQKVRELNQIYRVQCYE